MNPSTGKYFVKNNINNNFTDITTLFNGVAITKVDGMNQLGEPVNIYTAQWINSQVEDFAITTTNQNSGTPTIVRKNTDIEITFIISRRYATTTIDELTVHDNFINYMTNSDVWIKSSYMNNKTTHCICLSEYKPTTINIKRGDNSFIIGTIKLHKLGD